MGTDEQYACKMHLNEVFELSLKSINEMLIAQPDIAHLVMHGGYNENRNEYFGTIPLDKTPALRVLLRDDNPFNAYYASIAMFIEDEMLKFTRQKTKKITYIPVTDELDLFNTELLRELLECIVVNRFGCHMEKIGKNYFIRRGKIKTNENGYTEYYPNTIFHEYLLRSIFKNDENVQNIKREILNKYHQDKIKNIGEHKQYDWNVLIKYIMMIIDERIRKDYLDNIHFCNPNQLKYIPNLTKKCSVSLDQFWRYTLQLRYDIKKPNYTDHEAKRVITGLIHDMQGMCY